MEFSEHQRLFLVAVCKHFHETGTWPTYGMLDRALRSHKDLDVEQVSKDLDAFVHDSTHAPLSGWDPKQSIVMNVSALHTCQKEGIYPELREDLDAFMAVVLLCVAKYDVGEEEAPITADDFRSEYPSGIFEAAMGNALRLIEVDGFFSSIGYDEKSQPVQWTLKAPISIRKYRDVKTIEDYLAVRKRELGWYVALFKAAASPDLDSALPRLLTVAPTPEPSGARHATRPRIFVSHKAEDAPFASKLVEHLNAAGAQAWLDNNDLGAGDFQERIGEALDNCEWFILVLTRRALASPWVKQEVSVANLLMNKGQIRNLILIRADSVNPEEMPTMWRIYQVFDGVDDYASALIKTLKEVGLLPANPGMSN